MLWSGRESAPENPAGVLICLCEHGWCRDVSLTADLVLMRLLAVEDFAVMAFGFPLANALSLVQFLVVREALVCASGGSREQ